MLRKLKPSAYINVSVQAFDDCLRERPRTSTRNVFASITPEKPRWLNDHYVALALAELVSAERIVKVPHYHLNSYLPMLSHYSFNKARVNMPAYEEARLREIDNQCLVNQIFRECREKPRFDERNISKTVAVGQVTHRTDYLKKQSAEPCALCWKNKAQEQNIRFLVENMSKYDFREITPLQITGTNEELQEVIIQTCVEMQCAAEVNVIKPIVQHAIDIRQKRTGLDDSGHWSEGDKEEVALALRQFINSSPS